MSRRPSDLRLLSGIDRTLGDLIPDLANETHATTLEMIRAVVGELLTRRNTSHQDRIVSEGLALVRRATNLVETDGGQDAERFIAGTSLLAPVEGQQQDSSLIAYLLTSATSVLGKHDFAEARLLLQDIIEWEVLLWSARRPDLPGGSSGSMLDRAGVERSLLSQERWRNAKILRYDHVTGGYSKTTVMIDLEVPGEGEEQLVLRAEQNLTPFMIDGSDIVREYHALRAIHAGGIAIAEPLMLEADKSVAGARFLVSRRLQGRSYGNFLGGSLPNPARTLDSLTQTLASIHRMPLDGSEDFARSHLAKWAAYETMEAATRAYVAYWRDLANRSGCGSSPAVQRAFDWLERNVPQTEGRPVLVHGDCGLHNVLLNDDIVAGVIDWESSSCGDPADDFATFFGATRPYANESAIYQMYRDHGGLEISAYRLRYFSVLACMKSIILGQASLEILDREPDADLKFSFISYRYVDPILARLNEAIRSAEAAQP